MVTIRMPDNTLVEFPDDMPKDQIRGLISQKFPETSPQPVQRQAPVGVAESVGRGALSGITAGFADEIAATLAAGGMSFMDLPEELEGLSLGELRSRALQQARTQQRQAREQNPTAFGLSELGGAVALPVGAGARTTAELGKAGLATGALFGAGETEKNPIEDPIGFTEDVLIAGGIGLGTGIVAGKVLGGIGSKMSQRAKDPKFTKAESVVVNRLRDQGFTDDQIAKFASEAGKGDVPLTIGEAAQSKALLGRQKRLAQSAGDAGEVFEEFANRRSQNIEDTVKKFIKEDVSKITTPTRAGAQARTASQKAFDNLVEKRAVKAMPLYEAAYAKEITEEAANGLLQNPIIRNSLDKISSKPTFQADLGSFAPNSVGVFDRIKRDLDDQVEVLMRQGSKNEARLILNAKNELLTQLDNISPEYKLARQVFERGSKPIDKLNDTVIGAIADLGRGDTAKAGRKFFTEPAEEIRRSARILRSVNPESANALTAAHLTDLMDKSGSVPVFLRKVAGNKFVENKLKASMTSDQYAGWKRIVSDIKKANQIRFGSDTATNKQIDDLLTSELGLPTTAIVTTRGAKDVIADKAFEAAGKLLRGVADRFQNKNYTDLAKLMTGDGAEELAKKLSKTKAGSTKSLEFVGNLLRDQATPASVRAAVVELPNGIEE